MKPLPIRRSPTSAFAFANADVRRRAVAPRPGGHQCAALHFSGDRGRSGAAGSGGSNRYHVGGVLGIGAGDEYLGAVAGVSRLPPHRRVAADDEGRGVERSIGIRPPAQLGRRHRRSDRQQDQEQIWTFRRDVKGEAGMRQAAARTHLPLGGGLPNDILAAAATVVAQVHVLTQAKCRVTATGQRREEAAHRLRRLLRLLPLLLQPNPNPDSNPNPYPTPTTQP